jgi:hypothetical protein
LFLYNQRSFIANKRSLRTGTLSDYQAAAEWRRGTPYTQSSGWTYIIGLIKGWVSSQLIASSSGATGSSLMQDQHGFVQPSGSCSKHEISILRRLADPRLISCDQVEHKLWVLQYYEKDTDCGATGDLPTCKAGVTVSVYDGASFDAASKPSALQSGWGEDVLPFRFSGKEVDHLFFVTKTGMVGILISVFNTPSLNSFVSLAFDEAQNQLIDINGDKKPEGDMGIPFELSRDGLVKVCTVYSTDVERERDWVKGSTAYQFKDGKFSRIHFVEVPAHAPRGDGGAAVGVKCN